MKKFSLVIFLTILVFTSWIRFSAIKDNNFPITTDQGRDLIDIRSIAVSGKLRLIGPTTSINGVYLGPFWYYFNLPPFIATGGDPAALMSWQIFWYQLAGLLIFIFIRKSDAMLAFFSSILYLLMPLGFNTGRYFWNANAMPIFTALFLLSLYLLKQKTTPKRALVTGLLAGLALQIEAAFGIIFFPFSFLYLLTVTRKAKTNLAHFIGFAVTLLPQVVFEVRHQFPGTQVFLSEISGAGSILGQKLTVNERLMDRYLELIRLTRQISHLSPTYLFPILVLLLFVLLFSFVKNRLVKPLRDFFLVNLSFVIFAAIFYLAFPSEIKSWYLLGFTVPLIFIYATGITFIFSKNIFAKTLIILLLVASLSSTVSAQFDYLAVAGQMGDRNKSTLKNSLTVIDWVYARANGNGFKAYNYLPSVYDYPYQYLYWWYGGEKYGYRPNDLAYLPAQPEYIENRTAYLTPIKTLPGNESIFLIIENEIDNPQFLSAWLGNFANYCVNEKMVYPFGVEVRKLRKCPNEK